MSKKTSESSPPVSARQEQFLRAHHRQHHIITLGRLSILILFLGFWETAARLAWIDSFFFSSPSGIVQYLFQMVADRSLFTHTGVTLFETVASFLLVTVLSLSLIHI